MENTESLDDYNRPITMEDVVTPITKQPIEQIDANLWPSMDINELWEQKTFLQTRYSNLAASGHPAILSQMQQGLLTLDQLISSKTPTTPGDTNGSGLL